MYPNIEKLIDPKKMNTLFVIAWTFIFLFQHVLLGWDLTVEFRSNGKRFCNVRE